MRTMCNDALIMRACLYAVSLLFLLIPSAARAQVTIQYNQQHEALLFGITQLENALADSERSVMKVNAADEQGADIFIRVDTALTALQPEGYVIGYQGGKLHIDAIDPSGAMYGVMDVAEQLSMGRTWKSVQPKKVNPHFTVRALKFNLPWSSYRTGPAMEQHSQVCRNLEFWRAFIDQMALNRFNVLSLWNVHPFSFMVKPVNFPEANNFSTEEMAEWRKFWTALFRMCRDRGIEPFIVNWNIAVSPEFARHYGVMERNDTSAIVKQYTREVVTQVINEYPDLAGIGITLADWMSNFRQPGSPLPEMTPKQREDWIAETVIAGIKDAARPVKLLHRSVLSADPREMRRVIDEADLPDTTLVEIKFNWSHGHSSPTLLLTHDRHSGQVENHYWDPLPDNYRIQWMIRNEDFFILRWGDPDFIRQHIKQNSQPYVNGYFVGSEGYIPAEDYSHRANLHRTWDFAFQKQWLFYQVWGRLLYDPLTPDDVFKFSFKKRYKVEQADSLLYAFSAAGRMPLRLASFHAATWDYTLYSEGFLAPFPSNSGLHDTVSSFISIDELIDHPTLDPLYVSIHDYVASKVKNKNFEALRITPLELADNLEADAEIIRSVVNGMRPASGALSCELDDLETWAYLSVYFADKLRAGVALETFRRTGRKAEQLKSVALLRKCLEQWRKTSELTASHYQEVPYIDHLGYGSAYKDALTFSWSKYLDQVKRDIQIAEQAVTER